MNGGLTRTPVACPANLCQTYDLGLVDYRQAWQLQRRLVEARIAGEIPDQFLLLEHPPVFTIGKAGTGQNMLVASERLVREHLPLFYTDRGGDITYHGPGQLVGYPIIHLRERGIDLHRYVWCLEEVMLRTLADLAITACRRHGYPGVWLGERKVGAIGIRVTRWVSSHGFALNVNGDLRHFAYIRPCGLEPQAVTSISEATGQSLPVGVIKSCLFKHFSRVFQVKVEMESPRELSRYYEE